MSVLFSEYAHNWFVPRRSKSPVPQMELGVECEVAGVYVIHTEPTDLDRSIVTDCGKQSVRADRPACTWDGKCPFQVQGSNETECSL